MRPTGRHGLAAIRGILFAVFAVISPAEGGQSAACPPPTGQEATLRQEIRRGHEIRFRARLEALSEALHHDRYDVILLGDSLVQLWPEGVSAQVFPGLRVLNAGIAGDGTAALLYRLASRQTEAVIDGRRMRLGISGWEKQDPRIVLILLGTNDLRRSSPCDVVAGLKAVAERVRWLWPRTEILLLSLLPRGADQREFATAIATINTLLAAGAGMAPAYYRFVDVHGALTCETSNCSFHRPPNFVHLNEAGYASLAEALRRNLALPPR